jgi:hypothetical protein
MPSRRSVPQLSSTCLRPVYSQVCLSVCLYAIVRFDVETPMSGYALYHASAPIGWGVSSFIGSLVGNEMEWNGRE